MATETTGAGEAVAAPPEEVIDLKLLDPVLAEFKGQKGAVIPILQRAQDIYGYLPKEVMAHLAKKSGFPLSRLYGVATFYAQFRLTRRGRHLVRICDGTACHVRGAAKNLEAVAKQMGVAAGETSPDYRYTVGDRLLPGLLRPGAGGGHGRQGPRPADAGCHRRHHGSDWCSRTQCASWLCTCWTSCRTPWRPAPRAWSCSIAGGAGHRPPDDHHPGQRTRHG